MLVLTPFLLSLCAEVIVLRQEIGALEEASKQLFLEVHNLHTEMVPHSPSFQSQFPESSKTFLFLLCSFTVYQPAKRDVSVSRRAFAGVRRGTVAFLLSPDTL